MKKIYDKKISRGTAIAIIVIVLMLGLTILAVVTNVTNKTAKVSNTTIIQNIEEVVEEELEEDVIIEDEEETKEELDKEVEETETNTSTSETKPSTSTSTNTSSSNSSNTSSNSTSSNTSSNANSNTNTSASTSTTTHTCSYAAKTETVLVKAEVVTPVYVTKNVTETHYFCGNTDVTIGYANWEAENPTINASFADYCQAFSYSSIYTKSVVVGTKEEFSHNETTPAVYETVTTYVCSVCGDSK